MNAKYNGYSFEMRDSLTRTKVEFHNRYAGRRFVFTEEL